MRYLRISKLIIAIFILIITSSLCSCTKYIGRDFMLEQRSYWLSNSSSESKIYAHAEAIKEAVKNNDKDAIYNVFSQKAKDSGISDEDIYEFIDFFKDDIDTLNPNSIGAYEHQESGNIVLYKNNRTYY